jgi:uncharacterized transporter YbjL
LSGIGIAATIFAQQISRKCAVQNRLTQALGAFKIGGHGHSNSSATDSRRSTSAIPDYIDLEVTNPNCDGIAIRNLPFLAESAVVFSRLFRNGKVIVPEDDSVIHVGDSLRLVAPQSKTF